MLYAVLFSLLLLPLVYLSAVRLVGQFVVPTDASSLWAAPAPSTYGREALPTLRRLAMLDPLSPDYRSLMSRCMISQGDPGADKWTSAATSLSVADPENRVLAGMLKMKRGGIDEGLAEFERAVSLNPTRPATYFDAGLSLFEALPAIPAGRRVFFRNLAQLDLALSFNLDESLWQDPRLCLALATIMAEKGYTPAAVFWVKRIVLQPPADWPFAIKKLALCFSLGERVEAVSTWRSLFFPANLSSARIQTISSELNKYPDPDFGFMRADIDVLQGRLDSAQRELSTLVGVRPNVADYRLALGGVYERLGRRTEARLCYEKALQLSPANQEAKRKVMELYTNVQGSRFKVQGSEKMGF
jgi:tetratricopeptide (TPR) repeat protein